jgi:mannose-1-phosphate guanylyltransferase
MYAIIIAGGSGTRLWPKSREASPKQLHSLITGKSMVQETIARIKKLIPPRDIFIVTNENYAYKIRAHLPQIPKDNYILEPYPLGTAMAIGLAATRIAKIQPEANIVVLWADAHIENPDEFLKSLRRAQRAAQISDGAILGINPTYPSTGYGYIRMGQQIKIDGKEDMAYKIESFIEKPNYKTAVSFVKKWEYLWNTGISVWRVERFLTLFEKLLPKHYQALNQLEPYLEKIDNSKKIGAACKNLDPVTVDYAIYEKAKNLTVVPADLEWSDVGTWTALQELLKKKGEDNVIRAKKFVEIGSRNCLVDGGERLIALVGVEDLIIVDTDDVVLVTNRKNAAKVKDLINKMKEENLKEYL